MYKEAKTEGRDELEYIKGISKTYPDFLSGTSEKIRSYSNEYYEIIFNHFSDNLRNADKLVIIGYGFWDSEINKFIQKNFLELGKTPVVIDPYPSSSEFYQKNSFELIQESIDDITLEQFESLLQTGRTS